MENNLRNVIVNGVKYSVEISYTGESNIYDKSGKKVNKEITTSEYFNILTEAKTKKAFDQDQNELEVNNVVVNDSDNNEYEIVEILEDNKIKVVSVMLIKPESIVLDASKTFVMTNDEGERCTSESLQDSWN
jgi:hypothetical protein